MPGAGFPRRRINFVDLMVMVAATALGLATLRPYLASFQTMPWLRGPSHWRTIEITYGVWSCVAAWWMVALLVLAGRRPRLSRARLARRPGFVACAAGAASVAMGIVHVLVQWAAPSTGRFFSIHSLWLTLSVGIGPTVAGAWLILALSGRWRSDPGWMDRLGRALGWCWIGWRIFWMIPRPILERIPPIWDGVVS